MASILTYPKFKAFDSNGNLLSGGLLYTYEVGTTTPKATYSDRAMTIARTNPVVLDTNGEEIIYGDGFYDLVLRDSLGIQIWTISNIEGSSGFSFPAFDVDVYTTYGGYTKTAIDAALTALGATNKYTLVLRPGTWVFDANADYSTYTNVEFKVSTGAILSHGAYTINIPNFKAERFNCLSGTGLVTFGTGTEQIYPEWFGATSVTFQQALNSAMISGLPIDLYPDKSYPQTVALTMLRSSTGQSGKFFIRGNGAKLSWVDSGLTLGNLFSIGATSDTYTPTDGQAVIKDLTFIGPETTVPVTGSTPTVATPDGTTVGLYVCYADNVRLDNVIIDACYEGYKTFYSTNITSTAMSIVDCYISHHIDSTSKACIYTGSEFKNSYVGILGQAVIATTDVITSQTFIQPVFTKCLNGIHLDSVKNIIGFSVIDPVFTTITYDLVRMGIVFTRATYATRGADSAYAIVNPSITGGSWDDGSFASTNMAIVFPTVATLVYGGTFTIPATRASIVNRPYKSTISSMANINNGSASNVEVSLAGSGWVTFTGADGAIIKSSGNISSVTRNSTGNYTVTFYEPYDEDHYYTMSWMATGYTMAEEPDVHGVLGKAASFGVVSMVKASCTIEVFYESQYMAEGGETFGVGDTLYDPTYVTMKVEGIVG